MAAVTLGLGAGVAGATFTLVRQVVLEALPVRDESSVVVAWGNHLTRGFDHFPFSYPAFERIAAGANGVQGLAGTDAWGAGERLVEDGASITPVRFSRVLGDFSGVFGVRPVLGRSLEIADDVSGGARVAVVSWGLWMRRWGGERSALGALLTINGESHTVVGVLPREFDFPRGTEVWVPMRPQYAAGTTELPRMELDVVARLEPGTSADRFGSEIDRALAGDVALADAYRDVASVVQPLRDVMLGGMQTVVLVLFAGSALLLLVAIVNVVSLALIRAGQRSAAQSVRRALGARGVHLTVGPLVEAAIVIGLAGIVAVIVVLGGLRLVLPLAPANLPALESVRPESATWFTLAVVLVSCWAVLAGIPLLRERETTDGGGVPQSSERVGARRKHSRSIIMAGQAALAFWAVVSAALLVRSLSNLRALDSGFDGTDLYVVQIDHGHAMFAVPSDWPDRVGSASTALRRTPGVIGATPVLVPPLVVNGGYDIVPAPEAGPSPEQPLPYVNFETVMPDYFETLRLPVLRGRPVADADVASSQPVVVINEAAAKALWPGQDALGKRLTLPWPGYHDVTWTVVGIAADARYRALLDVRPSIYAPLRQMTLFAARWIAVRTDTRVDLAAAVTAAFAAADGNVRVVGAASVPERMAAPLARPRFALMLLGAIASIILLLAAVGAYGVMAAGVRGRIRELGVRMACGATPVNIGSLVLREGVLIAAAGAAIGAVGALTTGRFVETLLFGVRSNDPLAMTAALAIVLAMAALASTSPALRAARMDPLTVLRSET